MRKLRLLYPFLFVILPVLNTLTRNPGGATLADVGWLVAVVLTACAVGYLLVALATGGRFANPLVPLVVVAGILWFYGYPAIRAVYRFSRGTPAPIVVTGIGVIVAAGATFVALRWLARRPAYLDRVTTFLSLMGVLLVGWSGGQILVDQLRARSDVRNSPLAQQLGERPAAREAAARSGRGESPDIYLLILDEYANSAVLRDRFGFDNRAFEDSLRKLGFTIPELVQSNYVHTLLSLASILNFSHLAQLEQELGPRESDPALPNYLVENNRTAAFLQGRGYQFFFFPSQWWISTHHNRNADWEFRAWTGFDLSRDLSRSDLRRTFVGSTPLSLLRRSYAHDADHVKLTLDALAQIPHRGGRKFAFAHILNPHYPYVFDADCRVAAKQALGGWGQQRRDAYIGQIECLNKLLLASVNHLLRRSAKPPVILLVGDHGTNSLGYSNARSAEAVTPAQAGERFGALGAFYLPGGGERALADSVTLVNVVPQVLNYYFDARIPLAPDSLYMSLEQTPYLLAPVDRASLGG
jgi:hypothetical protein